MSGIVTNGPIVVGIRVYGPLAIRPSSLLTTWCGTLFGPLKSGPKRGTKPGPMVDFDPWGKVTSLYIYCRARA